MAAGSARWIDPERLQAQVEELAQFGRRGETGVSRLVYSPEWVAAQDRIAAWMATAGLRVERDAAGNVWGYLDGRERTQPIIATGSHIDSQNPGGRFDGALGVIAGVAALARAEGALRPTPTDAGGRLPGGRRGLALRGRQFLGLASDHRAYSP